ncbi:hypothetical protein [Deinococcus radiotolerans]|uniref:Uncharacterized protein n=1 Tax=Deinococcus radiotolerans TaxID=1309407 RepID=A0ABQ2FEV1_9DEIO|nr:hypothetical protein [Deinococcus radiotolerans]GGK91502.1 hypothetical protein GCM10010844_07480 [Deinococcus radiotolerans]
MTASRRRASPAARQEVTEALGSIRQQQRDARAYAEVWYQALRAWETSETDKVKVYWGPSKASTMRVVGIGSYSTSGTSQGGSAWVGVEMVHLPNGQHRSNLVGVMCSADPLLAEIHRGAGIASLLHHTGRGWAYPSDRAQAYARSVLGLAQALGDERARVHAQALAFAQVARTISVESQD